MGNVIEMNEADARAWLRKGVEWIREGLTLTDNTTDDAVCDMVLKALDTDLVWGWLWSMLDGVLDGGVVPKGAPSEVVTAGEATAINPLLVLSVIKAIWDLYQLFRNK